MRIAADLRAWARTAFGPRRPEPSYPVLPAVNDRGETNIKGLLMVGEVAGTPLIKLGLNAGVEAVDRLHNELGEPTEDRELYDVVIIGAGASGLGAAMRAHELGLRYLVLEAERMAMTVVNMYKGKLLFAEPAAVPNKSGLWFEECRREELLQRWRAQVAEVGLNLHELEKVSDVRRRGAELEVVSVKDTYRARRVLMAVGTAGNPRKAGVSGERRFAHKLHHHLSDPDAHQGEHIFIYGGGDVAAEAALALCEQNEVTMVTIDEALVYPKKRNVDALRAREQEGKLALHLKSRLLRFDESSVTFRSFDGHERTIENDVVFEMIGAELPTALFKRVGIKLEGSWGAKKWLLLLAVFLGVYTLYALKKFPEHPYSWPFYLLMSESTFDSGLKAVFQVAFWPFHWLFTDEAYQNILATRWYQQSFLYSFLYTVVMLVFGIEAMKRWGRVASKPGYQKWRYVTLLAFQVGFFLIVNIVAVQAMAIQYSWRGWGLYAPWPLFFNTFFWWNESDPRLIFWLFVGVGLLGFLVAIPLASRRHGKRFCTWICGCGGLAETLGDRWRHLSPKGKRSRAWEFQAMVVLAAAAIVTLVTIGAFDTRADNAWATAYSYMVDFWLVAVVPVALYPFFGGKVWCRYWCPLAAWNQIWARLWGKLKIKANDKCITCTLCSKYCQVGVDVMAFAKNGEAFDNRNSACIQCGICIDVCPMDVLSFATGDVVTVDRRVLEESLQGA